MKHAWRKRILLGSACVALLVVLALVIWRWSLASDNDRALAGLRRAGIPTSAEELNGWYTAIPTDSNAAPLVVRAMEAAQRPPPRLKEMKLPERGQRLTNVALIEAYVATNRLALELIKEAVTRPHCRYAVNLLRGPDTPLEHIEPLRGLARLADCAALLAAERGAGTEAAEHIASMVGLARTLENEPVLLSQLVRLAMLNSAVRRFEHSLAFSKLCEADLLRLAGVFEEAAASTNGLYRALVGERAIMIPFFRASSSEVFGFLSGNTPRQQGINDFLTFPLLRMSGYFERDLRFYLRAMDNQIAQSRLGPPESLQAGSAGEELADEARRRYCIMSALSLPALSRAMKREAESLALIRMAVLASAIEQFSITKGKLPADLAEIAPAGLPQVAQDPCDGEPLRYRRLENGYLLYSVGGDRRDDGGVELERGARRSINDPEDVIFRR